MRSVSLKTLITLSAVLGYSIGLGPLYIFHVLALLWFLHSAFGLIIKNDDIEFKQAKLFIPIWFLFAYCALSVLWVPDVSVWFRYMFYLTCGLATMLSAYQNIEKVTDLRYLMILVGSLCLLNFLSGALEVLTTFRLPFSPYSSYVEFFGHRGVDLSFVSDQHYQRIHALPTGFNWNPNNFVFIVLIFLPFALFCKNKLFSFLAFILGFWFVLSVGSRGHFLAYFVLIFLLLFYIRLTGKMLFYGVIGAFGLGLCFLLTSGSGVERVTAAFSDIYKGVSLLLSDKVVTGNSLSTRAFTYEFGLQELLSTYGLGLGFGGIESRLIEEWFRLRTFHFFFLQLLIDLGILMYSFVMGAYFLLAFNLRQVAQSNTNSFIRYAARSCSLSLVVAIPASLAPSSIHYNLTYYVLIGLSLSVLKLHLDQVNHENSATFGS